MKKNAHKVLMGGMAGFVAKKIISMLQSLGPFRSFSFPVDASEGASVEPMISNVRISKLDTTGDPSLKKEDIFAVKFRMKLISGESEDLEILLPKSQVNSVIDFDRIEHETLGIASERGIYAGKAFPELIKTYVAGLCAVTYPSADSEVSKMLAIHIDNLFAVDDWVDEHGNVSHKTVKASVDEKISILRSIMALKSDGGVEALDAVYAKFLDDLKQKGKTPLTMAFATEFVDQLKLLRRLGLSDESITSSFIATLKSYFDSVVTEKSMEGQGKKPSISQCENIRADASGAMHAINLACFLGVDVPDLELHNYDLKNMKTSVVNCVEFSNDLYSLLKEHHVIYKHILKDMKKEAERAASEQARVLQIEAAKLSALEAGRLGSGLVGTQEPFIHDGIPGLFTPPTPPPVVESLGRELKMPEPRDVLHRIRDAVAFNIVQISWQQNHEDKDLSVSLKKAVKAGVDLHNERLRSYYLNKSVVLSHIADEKAVIEAKLAINSSDPATLLELTDYNKRMVHLDVYFKVLEGWLAHGWWALAVPRYNLGIEHCTFPCLLGLQEAQTKVLDEFAAKKVSA